MTCPYCIKAGDRADFPLYDAVCKTCTVRAFAHGFPFWQSKRDGAMVPAYVQALKAAFGDGWMVAHAAVKAESDRIEKERAA